MANLAARPILAVGRGLRAAGRAAFTWGAGATQAVIGKMSLVPFYLSNLLWLINSSFLDLARYGFGGNSVGYACLRLLSQSVPEPPLIAYRRVGEGTQDDPLPYDHPLRKLIRNPNPLMTEYEFWELTTLHMGIAGRTTWWKERNVKSDIIALWPLRPDRVGPIYSADITGDNPVILGWSYLVPGTSNYIPIPRRDVFFANWPDPAGDSGGVVEGLGPLQVLANEVGADNEATKFVGSLLANSAIPGAVIQTKNAVPSEAEMNLIKAGWNQQFGGMRRGQVAVIDADSKVTQMGFDLQQLEFPALRKHTESRVAAAFGVPAILVGLQVGLESGVRATIAEQREYFADTTLSNYWRRYEDAYTRDVVSEFGPDLYCKFDLTKVKALAVLSLKEVEKITVAFKNGATTLDEYRKSIGLLPLPNGVGNRRLLPREAIEVDEHGMPVFDAVLTQANPSPTEALGSGNINPHGHVESPSQAAKDPQQVGDGGAGPPANSNGHAKQPVRA